MRNLYIILLALWVTLASQAAYIAGDVFVATDASGTNAVPTNSFNIISTNASLKGTLRADTGIFTNNITLNGVNITNQLYIWTNDNGTLRASGTGSVTQAALSLNTNRFQIGYDGTIFIGDNLIDWWGEPGSTALIYHTIREGAYLLYLDNSGDNQLLPYVDIQLSSSGNADNGVRANYYVGGPNGTFKSARLMADEAGTQLFLIEDNTIKTMLSPNNENGATPYILDTNVEHTSGNLVELSNDGALKFNVSFNGTVTITGGLNIPKTITPVATTGAQEINKASGRVNFAAAAQMLVVTDSLCTINSIILATVATDDTTALSCKAIPGNGSFTLKLNAAATAETAVNWLLTN
jgi:hypothetical protein